MFPAVKAALETIMPASRLKWISFGHVESDECGAMNLWLEAAPQAQVVHGATACLVSLGRPRRHEARASVFVKESPRMLADGEVLDQGGRRVRLASTPRTRSTRERVRH